VVGVKCRTKSSSEVVVIRKHDLLAASVASSPSEFVEVAVLNVAVVSSGCPLTPLPLVELPEEDVAFSLLGSAFWEAESAEVRLGGVAGSSTWPLPEPIWGDRLKDLPDSVFETSGSPSCLRVVRLVSLGGYMVDVPSESPDEDRRSARVDVTFDVRFGVALLLPLPGRAGFDRLETGTAFVCDTAVLREVRVL